MNIAKSFLEAMESLSANKVRSGLTILGIVIGVAAVVSMVTLGNGATRAVSDQIASLLNIFAVTGMRVERTE